MEKTFRRNHKNNLIQSHEMSRHNGVFTTIQINQQKTPRLLDLILIEIKDLMR